MSSAVSKRPFAKTNPQKSRATAIEASPINLFCGESRWLSRSFTNVKTPAPRLKINTTPTALLWLISPKTLSTSRTNRNETAALGMNRIRLAA